MNFLEKYRAITQKNNSFLCIGLDSELSKIPFFIRTRTENPIWEYNRQIIDFTYKYVAAFKLNLAFYISAGNAGLAALKKTISYIPPDIPVILDVKIGDIANTMKKYASAYFDYLRADSVTVNPLMGFDTFEPLLRYKDKYLFSLVLTSNPSSIDLLNTEQRLYIQICYRIREWNRENIGAVVGATNANHIKEIRSILQNQIFLIPGIGAQGGDLEAVMQNAPAQDYPNILISSSRSIIYAGRDKDFAKRAGEAAKELQEKINSLL
jgi:orotidine-5'-phosphate decarboxylase